ncbi:MAG: hypothetical protein MZU97_08555 [Bacillus subtilis]|nr:hypothetical protein [Bacillus subtilis]
MESYQNLWNAIKQQLAEDLDEAAFKETFVDIANVFKVSNNNIYLIAPNPYVKGKIENFWLNPVERDARGSAARQARLQDPHEGTGGRGTREERAVSGQHAGSRARP